MLLTIIIEGISNGHQSSINYDRSVLNWSVTQVANALAELDDDAITNSIVTHVCLTLS